MKKLLFLMFFILISALSVYSQETYPNAKKHMDVYVNGTLALPSFDGYFYYMQGCPNIFDTKEHINNPNIHYLYEKPGYHFFQIEEQEVKEYIRHHYTHPRTPFFNRNVDLSG